MDERVRALVGASAAIATGAGIEEALGAAADVARPGAVEEMILQSYLFVGYPRALQAMALWREVSGVPAPAAPSDDREQWAERGERVCARVYGGLYERLRHNVARLHPDLERWMLEEGYGKVLGRPGLELAVRELCIVALLAVQHAPAQLHSHLRGALNAGASEDDVTEAVTLAARRAPDTGAAALRLWNEVRARRAPPGQG